MSQPVYGPCGAPAGTRILWPTRAAMAAAIFKKGGVGAELGVMYGDFSAELLKQAKPNLLYLVDSWNGVDGEAHTKARFSEAIEQRRIVICPGFTDKVVYNHPNESFDWVYVDADHEYESVLKDLTLWWPKLKKDGWLCGHDYHLGIPPCHDAPWGVVSAVERFLKETPGAEFVGATGDASASFAIRHRAGGA